LVASVYGPVRSDWLVGLVRELLTYLWSSQLIELMMNVSC